MRSFWKTQTSDIRRQQAHWVQIHLPPLFWWSIYTSQGSVLHIYMSKIIKLLLCDRLMAVLMLPKYTKYFTQIKIMKHNNYKKWRAHVNLFKTYVVLNLILASIIACWSNFCYIWRVESKQLNEEPWKPAYLVLYIGLHMCKCSPLYFLLLNTYD